MTEERSKVYHFAGNDPKLAFLFVVPERRHATVFTRRNFYRFVRGGAGPSSIACNSGEHLGVTSVFDLGDALI